MESERGLITRLLPKDRIRIQGSGCRKGVGRLRTRVAEESGDGAGLESSARAMHRGPGLITRASRQRCAHIGRGAHPTEANGARSACSVCRSCATLWADANGTARPNEGEGGAGGGWGGVAKLVSKLSSLEGSSLVN